MLYERARQLALGQAAAAINRALATDPEAAEALAALGESRVRVQVQGIGLELDVLLTGQGVRLEPVRPPADDGEALDGDAPQPDVEIRGPALHLFRVMLGAATESQGLVLPEQVSVRGDAGRLERLRAVLADLEVDWEALLAQHLGDVAAHEFVRQARAGQAWMSGAAASVADSTSEWLRYESGLVATQQQVTDYCTSVDALRDDCDRLEARLRRLESRVVRGSGGDR